jgi:hypothetical protein
MKYYTPELWIGLNDSDVSIEESDRLWDEIACKYIEQLQLLKPRLSARNYHFFRHVSLHDGLIVSFNVMNKTTQMMKVNNSYRRAKSYKNPITIQIEVLSGEYLYFLTFSKVSSFNVSYPKDPLLPGPNGFGDWGYAELSSLDAETLSYEVLFSTGATILVEFSTFSYKKKRFLK